MKITDQKQFDENSGYYAELTNKLDKLKSAYDEKEAINRQKFEDGILQDKMNCDTLRAALLSYVDDNQAELFKGSKSYKNAYVTVSLRSSSSLEFAPNFNANTIIDNIKNKFKSFVKRFIVSKESIDKAAVKASLKSKELDEIQLREIGFIIDEKETITLKIN